VLTIAPRPRAFITASSRCMQRQVPFTLIAITSSNTALGQLVERKGILRDRRVVECAIERAELRLHPWR
jgi:hypothetical protein